MKQPFLQIQKLSIGYRNLKNPLILPIDVVAEKGQLIALIGSNGSGKSTLLKTLSGIISPLAGHIILDNQSLEQISSYDKSLLVSVVLTSYPTDFFLRVEDVVAMGRYPYVGFWGRLRGNDREKVDQCMSVCGISHLKGRMMVDLSDGERQKTMIAKALAQDTPIMLLDEPTAFLDYPGKLELMVLLKTLAIREGKLILFSSHDLEVVFKKADIIWLIAAQKKLLSASPASILQSNYLPEYFNQNQQYFDFKLD